MACTSVPELNAEDALDVTVLSRLQERSQIYPTSTGPFNLPGDFFIVLMHECLRSRLERQPSVILNVSVAAAMSQEISRDVYQACDWAKETLKVVQ